MAAALFGKPRGKVIKHPGKFRATLKRMGLVHGDEPIAETVIRREERSKNPTLRREANLAQAFRTMRRKK